MDRSRTAAQTTSEGSVETAPNFSVARRWEALVNSNIRAYRRQPVTADKIDSLARSGYIGKLIELTSRDALCLETGCGSGALSLALARSGRSVLTLDIARPLLHELSSNTAALGIDSVLPLRGDLERLPLTDGSVDLVFNEGVVEHWTERENRLAVLSELARVLRPGGWLVVFVPNGRHPLYGWWKLTRYPGYAQSDLLPWQRFDSTGLAAELREVGLHEVDHDGLSPWSTLAIWPNWRVLRGLARVLAALLPEPLWLRRRCGFNLAAWGRKA